LEPDTTSDLEAVAAAVEATGVPVEILGKGSNILISDAGIRGIVLRLGKGFRWAGREGSSLRVGGAMPVPALAGIAYQHALAGLSFGVAIPATLGGAVRMNAGAHGHEMAEVIREVHLFLLDEGRGDTLPAERAGFSYRRSALPRGAVVVGAVVDLAEGTREDIRAHMDEAREWRRRTQPIAEPNCGSVFKNPPDGHAARLIDRAGLKGARVGRAHVSMKHANFIVADEGASADDVLALIDRIRHEVEVRTGIVLEPEVQVIGDIHHVAG
jgi:UDP-N-acetylmuramate dehydrogenase